MSFVVHYSKGILVNKFIVKKENPAPSALCSDEKTFCVGEVFETTFEDISHSNWRNDPSQLNCVKGAFSIAYADDDRCIFASDSNGIEVLYYYINDTDFYISDNIWDIVKCLDITFDDINQSWVRKYIISQLINGETFIKNLKFILPSNIAIYDAVHHTLDIREYEEFRYTSEVNTVEEAVERLDKVIDNAFKLLKEKFGNDYVYGMGLSGGLDSRVIPHYIKKNNMHLTTFNICIRKPHGILEANSCKNARKLAEAYGIQFKLVDYRINSIEDKLRIKTIKHPLSGARNILKFEQEGVPDFECLLSGGYGVLIGDYLPLDIMELDEKGLIAAIDNLFIGMNSSTISFKSRCIKAFNYIFKTDICDDSKYDIEFLNDILKEDFKEARQEIENFVHNLYIQKKYNNVDIFYKYFIHMLCSRDRYGAFESQFGLKRSFTLYMPFVFEETKKWNPVLLLDRKILKELIIRKIPEVANIGTDTFTAAPGKISNVFSRIISIINRVIRGNGTAIDEHSFSKKCVQESIRKCMNNDYVWFYKILDTRPLHKQLFERKHMRAAMAVWEVKYLIDCIESGEYKNFEEEI